MRGLESHEEDQAILEGRVERLLKAMEARVGRLEGLWRRRQEQGRVMEDVDEMDRSMKKVGGFVVVALSLLLLLL